MLSVQSDNASTATSTVRIKTLDTNLVKPEEQKDLEEESEDLQQEEPANNEQPEEQSLPQESSIPEEEEEVVAYSGLSLRADAIKQFLQQQSNVKAISLKADGASKEISYNTSSSETRNLLSGRPSIVGEIEDLNLIVVQSLQQISGAALNKHTLPVPLCHNQSNGDYLVFRVDSEGKAVDVSLKEYQEYSEKHKALTATAVNQYNADTVQIKSNSPFTFNADISLKSLRGALAAQIESESVDDAKRNESEIQDAVKEELQKLVDDAVSAMTVSVMEDGDYKPEEDVSEDDDESVFGSRAEQQIDERPFRSQLQDALEHVQEIGKLDGHLFAERICTTFYELNGTHPTLDELTSLYSKIRTDFANEAEEELDDESEAETDTETVDGIEDQMEEALDVVRRLGRLDGRALAEGVIDALYEHNGEQPSLEEVTSVWIGIQDQLAAEADEESEVESDAVEESEDEESDEDDIGSDLDEALEHIRDIGALDGEAMAGNLLQIMLEENGEEPSLDEFADLWQYIQDQFVAEFQAQDDIEDGSEVDSEDEIESNPLSMYKSAATTVGADFISRATHLYLNCKGREPTEKELTETVRAFASDLADSILNEEDDDEDASSGSDDDDVTMDSEHEYGSDTESDDEDFEQHSESEYDPDNMDDQVLTQRDLEDDLKHEKVHFGDSMLNTPMVQSKTGNGLSWNVYFDEDDLSQKAENSNLKRAMQGFKVRNQRDANIEECQRIAAFLSVPDELCDEEDIQKPVAIATSRTKAKVFVSVVVEKKTAKGFSVYFNDEQEGNVDAAIQCFERSNDRKPNEKEASVIQAFIDHGVQTLNGSDLTEEAYVVSEQQPLVFSEETVSVTSDVEDDEQREQDDEEQANGEVQSNQFMKADDEEMIDIE